MATITAAGIGSGLEIEKIVTKLMEIERRPIDRVEKQQKQVNAQISAYGALKNKISSFQTAMKDLSSLSKFQQFKSASSNEGVLTASVGGTAAAGRYDINVQQLAQSDKFAFGPYANANTVIGGGTLTLSVGSNSFDVTLGANATLRDVRDAINSSADNTGVSATLVTGDDGARLVLSSTKTGAENTITVTASADMDGDDTDNAGLSALTRTAGTNYATTISSAQDAVISIDGITVSSSSNNISHAIDGLSFTAKSVGNTTLDVVRDDEKILAAVQGFADAYNALRTEIKNQRAGQLEADSTLLSMERGLSNVFNAGNDITGSSFKYLIEVGVSVDKHGVMNVDKDAVTQALDTNFSSFANLFAANGEGYANRLDKMAGNWLGHNGLIDTRQDGLNQQLKRLGEDKDRMELRMEMIELRIRSQFAAMDALVGRLSSTGDYVQQQLAALSGTSKK